MFVDSGVVSVVVRSEDTVLDQRSDPELTQSFAERLLVVALVGRKRPQIARIPAGDLLSKIGVTSFPVR